MDNKYIYIVFSSTPYRIGSVIRRITREPYNHVSLSLDKNLTQMYSFARRHYRTPLYGGFVRECPSRYQLKEKTADICLCQIPVTTRQYADLESFLSRMEENKDRYIYNHLSALCALTRKRIVAKDAFTCVEFCVNVLQKLGLDIDPQQFYTVSDLQNLLQQYVVYTGAMPQSTQTDNHFFAKQPLLYSASVTVRDMLCLIPRCFQK